MLIDCGKASAVTRGQMFWLYLELSPPPFNRNQYCGC